MNSFFSRVFSAQYANFGAIGNNLLLLAMYRFAYPFARLFYFLKITPNQLTGLSIVLAAGASATLVFKAYYSYYPLLWGLALLLDFSDGTLARMSDNQRKSAFKFDHSSDLFKVFLAIAGVGVFYDQMLVWGLALAACFSFMFFMVLNHDLAVAKKRSAVEIDRHPGRDCRPGLLKAVYAAIFTINGHTLLVFLVFSLGQAFAVAALSYLLFVSCFRSAVTIRALLRIPR